MMAKDSEIEKTRFSLSLIFGLQLVPVSRKVGLDAFKELADNAGLLSDVS